MITTDIINERFIQQTVEQGAAKIFDVQADVVNTYLTPRSGRLEHLVSSRHFTIEGTRFKFPMLTYMRFLDIQFRNKKRDKGLRAGLSVYNRVIWGVLYGEVMPHLRFGLTNEIREKIRNQIWASTAQQEIQFPE